MEARKVVDDGKALRSQSRKSKLTEDLGGVGLLTTQSAIDCAVCQLSDSKARKMIKDQLKFRQTVLKQDPKSLLYRFSVKGRVHTLFTLVSNLKEIVAAFPTSGVIDDEHHYSSLIGRTLQLSSEVELADGLVLSGDQLIQDFGYGKPFEILTNRSSSTEYCR